MYWTRADGTGDTARLTVSENVQEPNSFAPDGRTLVFREIRSGTQSDLWTLPVTNPASDDPDVGAPQPLLRTTFNESDGAVSPDGQWLAYASDESGRTEVYVQSFPGRGGKWLVSTGGSWPVWSHTESRLFYSSADGLMLVPYALKGQAFTPRKPETWVKKPDVGLFALAPDGRRFAVAQNESSGEGSRGEFRVLLNILGEVRRRADATR